MTETEEIKGLDSQAVQYYLSLRDQWTMFGALGHFPGALAKRDEPTCYWAGKTLVDHNIDYELFVEGQLKYRRLNGNPDY